MLFNEMRLIRYLIPVCCRFFAAAAFDLLLLLLLPFVDGFVKWRKFFVSRKEREKKRFRVGCTFSILTFVILCRFFHVCSTGKRNESNRHREKKRTRAVETTKTTEHKYISPFAELYRFYYMWKISYIHYTTSRRAEPCEVDWVAFMKFFDFTSVALPQTQSERHRRAQITFISIYIPYHVTFAHKTSNTMTSTHSLAVAFAHIKYSFNILNCGNVLWLALLHCRSLLSIFPYRLHRLFHSVAVIVVAISSVLPATLSLSFCRF